MPRQRHCTNCGYENPPFTRNYCVKCGNALPNIDRHWLRWSVIGFVILIALVSMSAATYFLSSSRSTTTATLGSSQTTSTFIAPTEMLTCEQGTCVLYGTNTQTQTYISSVYNYGSTTVTFVQYPTTVTETIAAMSTSTTGSVPDFDLQVTPSSNVVHAGSVVSFSVVLTLQKGFVDPVGITVVSGLPQGATFTLTQATETPETPGTTVVNLQIAVPIGTTTGTYPIQIQASGGGIQHSIVVELIVR